MGKREKGATEIPYDGGSGAYVVGDIVTFAGHTQTYVVRKVAAGSFEIYPGLSVAVTDNTAITKLGDHKVNLAFHRDAVIFATRPLAAQNMTPGQTSILSTVDPVSGLALRLEVSRQFKQVNWSFDVLYGAEVLRPELIVRVLA